MPVEEPRTESGFWPKVRAITGWPDTDEEAAGNLSRSWDQAATSFAGVTKTNVDGMRATWPDGNGEVFLARAKEMFGAAEAAELNMRQFGKQTADFASDVRETKNAIRDFVLRNDSVYLTYASMAPGVAEGFQETLVNSTAQKINRYVDEMAAKISADSSVLLSPVGPGGAPPALPPGPPPGSTPAQVKQWWDKLTEAEKAAVLRHSPDLIRNLDGIPATVRDAANRETLERELGALKARRDELYRLTDPAVTGGYGGPAENAEELQATEAKIKGLEAIQHRLDTPGPGMLPAHLLGLDVRDDGKAIVAMGNPDTAANVATFVPGMTSDLATIGGNLEIADRIAKASESPSTSVVTWLGYDAPDFVQHAGSTSYADGGKAALNDFQDGLRATHIGPPSHNTVVAHSYGTTLVGHTARDLGLNADDVALLASPGAGVDTVGELHLDGVSQADVGRHVHTTVAKNDIINYANGDIDLAHGPNPATVQFGGQVFGSAPGTASWQGGPTIAAHSEYFEEGNPALDHVGDIVAGRTAS